MLQGLPIGVKDVIDTADMPTEYNSPIYRSHQPRADAACVASARARGAVVIGKTVTAEFAYRHPGPTTNPLDPTRTPGGSSSGSAAGVAAGCFPLAFATQTGGSTIRPAAFCGVVGYKPSFGLISRVGVKPLSDSLDHVGVIARSVADCALLAAAASGQDLGAPERAQAAAPRIGVCRSPAWPAASPDTQALLERVAAQLGRAGAHVEARELPPQYAELEQAHSTTLAVEAAHGLAWELNTAPDMLSDTLIETLRWGLAQPPAALLTARKTLAGLRLDFDAFMQGLDILVTPSAPGEALALDSTGDHAFNRLWTALHVPCVTVPAGTGVRGLPLGIQIVGAYGSDRATLARAAWVESAVA